MYRHPKGLSTLHKPLYCTCNFAAFTVSTLSKLFPKKQKNILMERSLKGKTNCQVFLSGLQWWIFFTASVVWSVLTQKGSWLLQHSVFLEAAVSGWDTLTSSHARVLQEVTSMLKPSYENMEVNWNYTTHFHIKIMLNMKSAVSAPAWISLHVLFPDLPGLPLPFRPRKKCIFIGTSGKPVQTQKQTWTQV